MMNAEYSGKDPRAMRDNANGRKTDKTAGQQPPHDTLDFDATSSPMIPTNRTDAAAMNGPEMKAATGWPETYVTQDREGSMAGPTGEQASLAQDQGGMAGHVHVQIHKNVVEEPQTFALPVTREEVIVERVRMRGASQTVAPDAFQEQDIEVPVMGEEVIAEKRTRVREEIRLRKQQVTEQEQISDTVRNERAHIEELEEEDRRDDVPLAGSEEQPPANL
jgi:uncharacterized protein (TIGR02271 family)